MKKETLLSLFTLTVLTLLSSSSSSSNWQILTNHNFSSQIQLYPHLLLLITVPWCGESRSLMKDVSLAVSGRLQDFSTLKLMLMHRNTDKMLADSIGASSDGITLSSFHYSVSYKYRGRLAARNLLSSLQPFMSLAPDDVPLKPLNTPQDFRAFVDSTDKAENGFNLHDHLAMGFSRANDRTPVSRGKTYQKRSICAVLNSASTMATGFVNLLDSLPQ